jgi:hypothetical protein
MPAIRYEDAKRTQLFCDMATEAARHRETNDCAVKAIAMACRADYGKVLELLTKHGRKPRCGTPWNAIWATVRELGYVARPVDWRSMMPVKGHASVTTHHPARYPNIWKNGKTYFMVTRRHILTIIDGQNHDHTVGTSKRCLDLYEVVPASIALPQIRDEVVAALTK